MFKLFSVVVLVFATSLKLLSQDFSYPNDKQLQHFKLKQSCSFSAGRLQKRLQLNEIKMLDTLSSATCFLVETAHKSGKYAILKKRKNRFKLVYLNFKDLEAKPYFINDSIDFNRDKKSEVIIYYSATVKELAGFSQYNGTKTGILIADIIKHRALVSCNMSLCGMGVNSKDGKQVGACIYQFAMSFMPMRLVITSFTDTASGEPLVPPKIASYVLKHNLFERE